MSYSYLLFDLDGTLTDSGPGIMNAASYALKQFGIEETAPEKLRRFVGPPLHDSFSRFYGMSEADMKEAVRLFRVYYRPIGIYENTPYPGIRDFLLELRKRGKKLALATSKPMEMAEKVLRHFDLYDCFDVHCAGTEDESRNQKWQIVSDALTQLGVEDRSQALMIGDREQDVLGAAKNGIDCAGVLWGYGSRQEFETAGAAHIVENYRELLDRIETT